MLDQLTTFGVLWLGSLLRSGVLKPGQPVGHKIQLVLLTVILVFSGTGIGFFWWGVTHWAAFQDYCLKVASDMPLSLVVAIELASNFMTHFDLMLGLALPSRKVEVYRTGMRFAPILAVVHFVNFALRVHPPKFTGGAGPFALALGLGLFAGIYFWLSRFCAAQLRRLAAESIAVVAVPAA
jgi:hypothetical protein